MQILKNELYETTFILLQTCNRTCLCSVYIVNGIPIFHHSFIIFAIYIDLLKSFPMDGLYRNDDGDNLY